MKSSRLFVGNLPPNATDADLSREFSSYGRVTAVDIKEKADKKFAFINIEIDDYLTRQCIQEFKETAYKGYFLAVSVAKESFLDKLKREREEAAAAEEQKIQRANQRAAAPEKESDEFVIKKSKYADAYPSADIPNDDGDSFLIKKRNQGAYLENGKMKILGGTGAPIHSTANGASHADKPISQSEQKRLESMQKMKQAYNQQKFAIKSALKQADNHKNKKIVFDDQDRQTESLNAASHKKAALFDEDDDNEDQGYGDDFKSKKQFEGVQGQKLLELKTKFHNDDRFKMDENFHEGDDNVAEQPAAPEEVTERQRQLEILGSVVGRNYDTTKKRSTVLSTMLRFDPLKATHQKYYKTVVDPDDKTGPGFDEPIDIDEPVVSATQFYKVSDQIGNALKGEAQGFSLLGMMGQSGDDRVEDASYRTESFAQKNKSNHSYNENPFKYDSSDDEGSNKKQLKAKGKAGAASATPAEPKVKGKTNKRGIFRENFFVLEGDARLTEGLPFFSSICTGKSAANQDYTDVRRQLKKIVQRKVKKNQLKFKIMGKNKLSKKSMSKKPRKTVK